MVAFTNKNGPLGLATILLLALQQLTAVVAFPVEDVAKGKCRNPIVRREWRKLSKNDRLEYIDAVKCLQKKAPKTPKSFAGVTSRFDDFVATHIDQTLEIHFVGQFLPWHRFFTAWYETALREECRYKGAQPYWDWTLDTPAEKFTKSPVFDPVQGFGGNGPLVPIDPTNPNEVPGRTGGGCVIDGPFKNYTVQLGPADNLKSNPRCMTRDLAPYYAGRFLAKNQTDLTLKQQTFGHFARVMEGGSSFEQSGVHDGGHYGVGGTHGVLSDPFASPSDPLFYLHHANIDRVWWSWQKKDLNKRLKDISGPVILADWNNDLGPNTTLQYQLDLGYSNGKAKVADTMDIKGGLLCYDYDSLY